MKNLRFKRGEFITQKSSPNSFAIFGGEALDPVHEGDGVDYTLICYYNDNHFYQNSEGKCVHESVFEYDLDDDETCEYTINENDMNYWRTCTQPEIDAALKILAVKRLGWLEGENKFRKLAMNETLVFGDKNTPRNTGIPGGIVRHIGHTGPVGPTKNIRAKIITLFVKETWEQKEPISSMDKERREFILEQCEKLKNSFSSYRYGTSVVYPQNGAQVPRRSPYYGEGVYGDGMCAYNHLMQEADWWGYCD